MNSKGMFLTFSLIYLGLIALVGLFFFLFDVQSKTATPAVVILFTATYFACQQVAQREQEFFPRSQWLGLATKFCFLAIFYEMFLGFLLLYFSGALAEMQQLGWRAWLFAVKDPFVIGMMTALLLMRLAVAYVAVRMVGKKYVE